MSGGGQGGGQGGGFGGGQGGFSGTMGGTGSGPGGLGTAGMGGFGSGTGGFGGFGRPGGGMMFGGMQPAPGGGFLGGRGGATPGGYLNSPIGGGQPMPPPAASAVMPPGFNGGLPPGTYGVMPSGFNGGPTPNFLTPGGDFLNTNVPGDPLLPAQNFPQFYGMGNNTTPRVPYKSSVMSSQDLGPNGMPSLMGTAETGLMPTDQFMAQYGNRFPGLSAPGNMPDGTGVQDYVYRGPRPTPIPAPLGRLPPGLSAPGGSPGFDAPVMPPPDASAVMPPDFGGLPPGLSGTMGGPGSGPGGLGTAYLGMPGGMPGGGSLAKGPAQIPPTLNYAGGTPFFDESTGQYTRPMPRPNPFGQPEQDYRQRINQSMGRGSSGVGNRLGDYMKSGGNLPYIPNTGVMGKPGQYAAPNPGDDPRFKYPLVSGARTPQEAYSQTLAQYNSPEYAAFRNSLAPSTRAYMHAPGDQQLGEYLADQARQNAIAFGGKDPFGKKAGGIASLLKRR